MEEIDENIFKQLTTLVDTLPIDEDKLKHILFSRTVYSGVDLHSKTEYESFLASIIMTLTVGIEKEYDDKGLIMSQELCDLLDDTLENLRKIARQTIRDGVDIGDIIADLCGIFTGGLRATISSLLMDYYKPTVSAKEVEDVNLLDIWKIDNEYRLIARSCEDFNKFVIISLGTGESTKAMTGSKLHAYLSGKNPINAKFNYYGSLKDILIKSIQDYVGNYTKIVVPND